MANTSYAGNLTAYAVPHGALVPYPMHDAAFMSALDETARRGLCPRIQHATILIRGARGREALYFRNQLAINETIVRVDAVDGANANATLAYWRELGIRFVKQTTNAHSWGAFAASLSKVKAIRHQVENEIAFQVVLEDDSLIRNRELWLHRILCWGAVFLDVNKYGPRVVDGLRLATLGDGYLMSLDGARRILANYCLGGFVNNNVRAHPNGIALP